MAKTNERGKALFVASINRWCRNNTSTRYEAGKCNRFSKTFHRKSPKWKNVVNTENFYHHCGWRKPHQPKRWVVASRIVLWSNMSTYLFASNWLQLHEAIPPHHWNMYEHVFETTWVLQCTLNANLMHGTHKRMSCDEAELFLLKQHHRVSTS